MREKGFIKTWSWINKPNCQDWAGAITRWGELGLPASLGLVMHRQPVQGSCSRQKGEVNGTTRGIYIYIYVYIIYIYKSNIILYWYNIYIYMCVCSAWIVWPSEARSGSWDRWMLPRSSWWSWLHVCRQASPSDKGRWTELLGITMWQLSASWPGRCINDLVMHLLVVVTFLSYSLETY